MHVRRGKAQRQALTGRHWNLLLQFELAEQQHLESSLHDPSIYLDRCTSGHGRSESCPITDLAATVDVPTECPDSLPGGFTRSNKDKSSAMLKAKVLRHVDNPVFR